MEIRTRADEREKGYDWLGAAESYKTALAQVPGHELGKLAEISERLGYAFYRWARQAENFSEFISRAREAISNYEKAKGLYQKLNGPAENARRLRCLCMVTFLTGWIETKPAERKKLFDESWRIAKEALRAFKEADMALEYENLYNELSNVCLAYGVSLEWNLESAKRTTKEAWEHGEESIRLLSNLALPNELAKAYVNTAFWMSVMRSYVDIDEKAGYDQKAQEYWTRGRELSEEAAFTTAWWISSLALGTDESIRIFERSLEYGRKTRDHFIIATKLEQLTLHTAWKADAVEDPDERLQLLWKALSYARDSKDEFSRISLISVAGSYWVESPAEFYWQLSLMEANPGKKREFLVKALEAGPDLLKKAEDSGYPYMIGYGHHVFSKILVNLAKIEANPDKKKALLEEALPHRIEANRLEKQLYPLDNWENGVMQNYLADIKSELSYVSREPETRTNLLQEAIREKEAALKNIARESEYMEKIGAVSNFAWMGSRQYDLGVLLTHLYNITRSPEDMRKAAQAFEQSAEFYKQPNLATRIAECYWKAAQSYDVIEEHQKSSEKFLLASRTYAAAADKIPQLKELYRDHSLYMEAWSQIERARHHHGREEYDLARRYHESAAKLHVSTTRWKYLSSNYFGWAEIEGAEDLSRSEKSEEAIKVFREAERLFIESKTSIQRSLAKIENKDERQVATSLIKASDRRQEYCRARVLLEEAKTLGKKGEHHACSESYGMAADTLDKIAGIAESEQGRRELRLIATLSRAWQKMVQAEAEASAEMYLNASKLFEEAKDLAPNERTKMLALGHSRFCRALEAGTKFTDTGDVSLHATAVQQLETAAKYYLRAGFQNASEYAKASKLLFDAYVQMDSAEKERDHEKKARFYRMAEKVLEASADSYLKAEHPAKRDEVLRLLEKVKGERELAVSLTEIMHSPSIVSTTAAFSTPTPGYEKPAGLERFEQADIQANLITGSKSLGVGQNLDLEIELVNAGSRPAQLIKVEEIIPKGFEVVEKPEIYRVEDSFISMKGKRLDPLKTEELKLVLRSKVQGLFTLKPRILYLDETGRYRTHEPEPIAVTVKEMGISGWLKGPGKTG